MNRDQITGVIRALLTAGIGWAVGKGYIPNDQAGDIVLAGTTLGVAIWSVVTNTQTAKIQSINETDNGVKVVASTSGATQVNAPLKGN